MLKSIEMSDEEYNKLNINKEEIADEKKENDLDNLLLELKIISNIKEFDKICIRKNIEIDTPHILQSISRKLNGDGRDKTLDYINNIIISIFKIQDDLLKKEILNEHNITPSSTQLYLNKDKHIQKYNFKEETISIYQKLIKPNSINIRFTKS